MIPRVRLTALLLGGLLSAGPSHGQGPSERPDTLAGLRAAARAHPDSFDVLLALGRALSRRADEIEFNFKDRVEAAGYLDRANRLRPGDPVALMEYGLLLRKQRRHGDGLRVLQRAERAAEKHKDRLSPSEVADLHEQMGLLYELWWEDWATVGYLPMSFLQGQLSCLGKPGLLWMNINCHRKFNEAMAFLHPMENLKEDERAAMVRHFEAALEADAGRVSVAVRLMRWLADWEKWEDYVRVAKSVVAHRPGDADALLFLGLGYHETGRRSDADSAFARGHGVAGPDLRMALADVASIVPARRFAALEAMSGPDRAMEMSGYWGSRDPLFLTSENERLAEHYARMAYVELAFTSPASGMRGRFSTRGQVWLAYGRPKKTRTIITDGAFRARTIFWAYSDTTPDFVFSRNLAYRYSQYANEDSEDWADSVRRTTPESYDPKHPRVVASVPFQMARFRGADGRTELHVYSRFPVDSLAGADSVYTGAFVHALRPWRLVTSDRQTWAAGSLGPRGHFMATLDSGQYAVGVEALADRAATGRDTIDVGRFGGGLQLSDILLADRITPRVSAPRNRAELDIEASATLEFRAGDPIGVLWEIYGLHADSAGTARYDVRVEVRDADRGLVLRALRNLIGQGNNAESVLQWTASVPIGGTGVVVEYPRVTLEGLKPGLYRFSVAVTDGSTGATVSVEREFRLTH